MYVFASVPDEPLSEVVDPKPVRLVVIRRAAAQLCQHIVDRTCLRVACHLSARRVDCLDQVGAVVDKAPR